MDSMKYNVCDLEGALLDAAAAKVEGIQHDTSALPRAVFVHHGSKSRQYAPSTDWRDAGPIIERERIKLMPPQGDRFDWLAEVVRAEHFGWAHGDTPLIAAMRAYVVLKFGNTVELP